MKTFLLAGHGGFYNRGCEAIVRTTVSLLRERFGETRIILASMDHGGDRASAISQGMQVIPGWSPRWTVGWALRQLGRLTHTSWVWRGPLLDLSRSVRRADAVLAVGGDNYTADYRSYPAYHMDVLRLVREAGRPFIIWGASIGPFRDESICNRVMQDLRGVALIVARESRTVRYLADHGVSANVRLAADPAFLLPAEAVETSQFWPVGDEVLGINISPLLSRYREDQCGVPVLECVQELTRHAIEELGLGVVLIPHVVGAHGVGQDCDPLLSILQDVGRRGRLALMPTTLSTTQTKHVISQCRFFVGARTHSTIAALSSCVPTVSIAYSTKAWGINEDIFGHTRYVADVRTMTGRSLISLLHRLVDNEQAVRAHLARAVPEVARRARSAVDLLAGVLHGTGERCLASQ